MSTFAPVTDESIAEWNDAAESIALDSVYESFFENSVCLVLASFTWESIVEAFRVASIV